MSNTTPHSHEAAQIKISVLDYVFRVLGRLEDDSGDILSLRQSIKRQMTTISKVHTALPAPGCEQAHSVEPFIIAPLPKVIIDKMLPFIWHRDVEMRYRDLRTPSANDEGGDVKSLAGQL